MKKLSLIVALLVLFSFVPGLISCSKAPVGKPTVPTTPTAPTAPTTPTATAEQPFKPIVLKFATSKARVFGTFGNLPEEDTWINAIEAVTNGRIHFDVYWAESLVARNSADDAVTKGICDITTLARAYGQLPTWDAVCMPILPGTNGITNSMIYWFKLYRYLDKDCAAVNQIMIGSYCNSYVTLFHRQETDSRDGGLKESDIIVNPPNYH